MADLHETLEKIEETVQTIQVIVIITHVLSDHRYCTLRWDWK